MNSGRPNFSGDWAADLEASVFRMPPPSHLVMHIRHEGEVIAQRVETAWPDGASRTAELHYVIGGVVEAQVVGRAAKVLAQWRGDVLVIESRFGETREEGWLADHWSLSPDGALIMNHPDDVLAGQVCVLRRVDTAPPPPHR